MEKLQFSAQLINAILGYLGTRPYQEVFQLIEGIQNEVKEQQGEQKAAPEGEQ
jgi:hypothetical protein